ncbi:VanZ family protein [Ornithinibacillus contaminans]|uniref:VanZ family protein n=1 Tax=Ornithinibacillus contaminans TaxID=694055 RepID=UPI00064DEBFF|nr:VanZ family protein [Ornithinibacillus contaminans]
MQYINEIPILIIAITILVYVLIRTFYRKKRHKSMSLNREILYLLSIVYLECLLYLTLFPGKGTVTTNMASINLIPFQTINLYLNFQGNVFIQLINLVGNIVVFFPIGMLPVLLWRNISVITILLIGIASTGFIELMQLVLSVLGFISRSFDVDDLILNTLGVFIGYCMGITLKIINKKGGWDIRVNG